MAKRYTSLLAVAASLLLISSAFGAPLTTTFDFSTYESMKSLVPDLPPVDNWSTNSGSQIFFVTSLEKDGFDIKVNNNQATNAAKVRFNFYNDIYDLRFAFNADITINAPDDYQLESIKFTTLASSITYLSNMSLSKAENGSLVSDESTMSATWDCPEGLSLSSVGFTAVSNVRIGTIEVTASKIGGDDEPDGPEIGDVTYSLSIDGETLSEDSSNITAVTPGFNTISVTSPDGEITLAPDDSYGNSAVQFIKFYELGDADQMTVGGIEKYADGVLTLFDSFEAPGNYVIEVGAGVFIINGEYAPAATFYFSTGEKEVVPTTLYIRGAFNDYADAGNSNWQLAETGEGTGIYEGTFSVGEGQFEFNLQTNEGLTYIFEGDGVAPGDTPETGEEERPGVMLMIVNLVNGNYSGSMQMAMGGEENFFWANPGWTGGEITVTANLNTNTITITGTDNTPTPPVDKYMDEATVLNPEISVSEMMKALDLTWNNQTVQLVSETFEIPVKFNGEEIGSITDPKYLSLEIGGASEPGIATYATMADNGNILHVLFESAGMVRGEGTYSFAIPAKLVMNEEGEFNPAQDVEIVMNGLVEGSVTPEQGIEFKQGDNVVITITYEGETIETNYSEDAPLLVTNYDDYDKTFTWEDSELKLDTDAKQVVISLGDALVPGDYEVNFRENMILVDGVGNEAVVYTFSVVKTEPTVTYMDEGMLIDPILSEGLTTQFQDVIVYFADQELTVVEDAVEYALLYVNDSDEPKQVEYMLFPLDMSEANAPNDCIFVDVAQYTYTAAGEAIPGEYRVVIPAGIVKNTDGSLNPEQTFDITFAGTVSGKANPDEYTIVEGTVSEITITFPGETAVINKLSNAVATVNEETVDLDIMGTSVVFDITNWEPGTYSIRIPANLLIIDDSYYNATFDQSWEIVEDTEDGIAGIAADSNGAYNVFSINGVKLLNTTNAGDLKALGKGLYIINGKKTIIK